MSTPLVVAELLQAANASAYTRVQETAHAVFGVKATPVQALNFAAQAMGHASWNDYYLKTSPSAEQYFLEPSQDKETFTLGVLPHGVILGLTDAQLAQGIGFFHLKDLNADSVIAGSVFAQALQQQKTVFVMPSVARTQAYCSDDLPLWAQTLYRQGTFTGSNLEIVPVSQSHIQFQFWAAATMANVPLQVQRLCALLPLSDAPEQPVRAITSLLTGMVMANTPWSCDTLMSAMHRVSPKLSFPTYQVFLGLTSALASLKDSAFDGGPQAETLADSPRSVIFRNNALGSRQLSLSRAFARLCRELPTAKDASLQYVVGIPASGFPVTPPATNRSVGVVWLGAGESVAIADGQCGRPVVNIGSTDQEGVAVASTLMPSAMPTSYLSY